MALISTHAFNTAANSEKSNVKYSNLPALLIHERQAKFHICCLVISEIATPVCPSGNAMVATTNERKYHEEIIKCVVTVIYVSVAEVVHMSVVKANFRLACTKARNFAFPTSCLSVMT